VDLVLFAPMPKPIQILCLLETLQPQMSLLLTPPNKQPKRVQSQPLPPPTYGVSYGVSSFVAQAAEILAARQDGGAMVF